MHECWHQCRPAIVLGKESASVIARKSRRLDESKWKNRSKAKTNGRKTRRRKKEETKRKRRKEKETCHETGPDIHIHLGRLHREMEDPTGPGRRLSLTSRCVISPYSTGVYPSCWPRRAWYSYSLTRTDSSEKARHARMHACTYIVYVCIDICALRDLSRRR